MNIVDLPSISIVIPTLNSERTLDKCLQSIVSQDYPLDKLEVIIADAGSTDGTLDIIKRFTIYLPIKVQYNKLKTGEAGKAIGVKQAKNEIIALIDSDNILPQADWFRRMAEPFQDSSIIASEPLYYTYRRADSYINRYCALLGMNDPLCLFLGNYDRYSALTDKWTQILHKEEDIGNYLRIGFPAGSILPTIGANGFLIRRDILMASDIGDYLFDIDVLYNMADKANVMIAKVKIGIVHLYCHNMRQFIKKQRRRIRDYSRYKALRRYPWQVVNKTGVFRFSLYTLAVFPIIAQMIKGIFKTRDKCWLFHPAACILTLFIYGTETINH